MKKTSKNMYKIYYKVFSKLILYVIIYNTSKYVLGGGCYYQGIYNRSYSAF